LESFFLLFFFFSGRRKEAGAGLAVPETRELLSD
jgi:hypothetical protein